MEMHDGEEAGIKSATIQIKGHNAYGWLKTESGVHRLVRISPYDSAARRHTSFSSAWVYPVVDDTINIEINESDLKVDTYRSSGRRRPARQHHRLGHPHHPRADRHRRGLPAGAQPAQEPCDGDGDAEGPALRAGAAKSAKRRPMPRRRHKTDIGWGHQIRSYVLQPYQMVKDLRTERRDVQHRRGARRRSRRLHGSLARVARPGLRRHRRRMKRPALSAAGQRAGSGPPTGRFSSHCSRRRDEADFEVIRTSLGSACAG